jgi:uncharacterized circularly permuted ATP-grasp superfamily protein
VLADIYGPGALVADGALPAAAMTGSSDFLASLRGVAPPGGRWLRLYAADIGRGPDGRWWVLGDRTQAPSGSGYALENRLVVSQAFPSLYAEMKVQRLAPFFREFRAGPRAPSVRARASASSRRARGARPISNRPISRAISAFCSSRAATWSCARAISSCARSPG